MPLESNTNEFGHTFYPKMLYNDKGESTIVNSAKEEDEYLKKVKAPVPSPAPKKDEAPWGNK